MANPFTHPNAWTVVHNPDDDTLHVSPNPRLRLPASIDLLVCLGGGFVHSHGVWRFRPTRALLRTERAAEA